MIMPGIIELTALRYVPATWSFRFVGQDFTSADFAMEVRDFRDQGGSARIRLENATPWTEGVWVTVATEDGQTVSTVYVYINEATINSLPFTGTRGADQRFVWDLIIYKSDIGKGRWLEGPFIVHGGATQTL